MRYAVAPVLALALLVSSGSVGGDDAAQTTSDGAVATADPTPTPTTPADARPRVDPLVSPLGDVAEGPLPERSPLASHLSEELDSPWLGPGNRRAITVLDALTGKSLAERNSDRLMTPASTTKLLAAAAIATGLDAEGTFTTRVVTGPESDQVVIVAGGDMLLGDGAGDPDSVAGHAGLGDLAAQTAVALRSGTTEDGAATQAPAGPFTVALDLSHVPGPHAMPTWSEHWVQEGWAGRIVQLGRATDRALPYDPSPSSPEQEVARVFREALAEQGIEVVGAGDEDASAEQVEVAPEATELAAVESAVVRDVLALALATSDNAMVEQLARQAAVADGQGADQESVTAWITRTVTEDYGLDLTGMRIVDASGLSDGTRLSVSVIASVLAAAADGSHPDLQEVLAAGGLPIAGYTGTLGNGMRFDLPEQAPAVGNARAKTGSLPGITSLAGTVVTADGRLLVYAIGADQVEEGYGAIEAASALDTIVAELARCGC